LPSRKKRQKKIHVLWERHTIETSTTVYEASKAFCGVIEGSYGKWKRIMEGE
jgi:hypothetical protein